MTSTCLFSVILSRQWYSTSQHSFVKLTLRFNFKACLDSLYGGTASFFSKSGPIILFFITWGQQQSKNWNTAKNRNLTSHYSDIKGQCQKETEIMNNTISGVIGFTCPCITIKFVIHSASQITFKREKSITYLPHLGSSFPLVFAANWRQVLICCHQNWCINPRAPSFWCQGQYGWTSLSWNKLAKRKIFRKRSHVSFLTSAHS